MTDDSEQSLSHEIQRLKKLVEITRIINSTLDIGKLLQTVMESIKEILNAEASSLLFYEEESDALIFKTVTGSESEILSEQYRFSITEGIAGWCAAHRKPLMVNDVYSDSRFNPSFDKITGFKTEAIICAPLLFKGKLIGVVEGVNPLGRKDFEQADMDIFNLFAEQAVTAVQNAVLFEKSIERTKLLHEINSAYELFEHFQQPVTLERDDIHVTMLSRPGQEFSGDIFTSRNEKEHFGIMLADSGQRSLCGAITASYIAGKITAFARACKNSSDIFQHYSNSQKDIPIPQKHSILYGQLFTAKSIFEYSLTGSIQVLLFKDGKTRLIKANSNLATNSIKRTRLTLEKGTVLLAFTTGITELKNRHGELFGIKRLAASVNPSKSTDTILNNILERTNAYHENYLSFNDQTLICIKAG